MDPMIGAPTPLIAGDEGRALGGDQTHVPEWPDITLWEGDPVKQQSGAFRRVGDLPEGSLVPRIGEAVFTGVGVYVVTGIVHDWYDRRVVLFGRCIGDEHWMDGLPVDGLPAVDGG